MFTALLSAVSFGLCASRVIPRNRIVGIHAAQVARSEAAWSVGHSAAFGPAGVGASIGGLIWVSSGLASSDSIIVPLSVALAAVSGLLWARVRAVDAAADLSDNPEDAKEPERPLASPKITRSGGLIPAAVASWLPAVVLSVYRMATQDIPAQVASHWNLAGEPDAYVETMSAFWACLAAAVASAVVVTTFVIIVGDDIGRFSGSTGLGILVALAGMFSLTWITAVKMSADPSTSIFMLWPPALLLGGLVLSLASIRRPHPA